MALVTIPVIVTSPQYSVATAVQPLLHPAHAMSVTIVAKPGVQKQAAENFKWGH